MADRLPPELWSHIFDLAADEGTIFYPGLLTSFAPSTWSKSPPFGSGGPGWTVRTPQDTINIIQRRSYATKKSIIAACRTWRRLGTEFLVRCLFFDDPTKLRHLCAILDRDPSLGWWARRLHITHFLSGRGPKMDDFQRPLTAILQQCPNLEIFIVDLPMASAFGPIVDTLGMACRNLRTVHWHVPSELLSKVIWAMDTLPNLVAVHIEFAAPIKEPDTITLGSAQDVKLKLPNLQQLFLKGFSQDFMEQATGWSLPLLRSFSFHFGTNTNDMPDVVAFLAQHGMTLLFLDLYCIPTLDVCAILDLCPFLTTFCFNLDWKIPPVPDPDHPEDETVLPIALTNRPHEHIQHIGLHGLLYAFGVGYAAAYASADPVRTMMVQCTNDRNFRALNRTSFPKLERVRVLSPRVLQDLNDNDGPAHACFERWERWWETCTKMNVRLEDCSGDMLGNLPQDPVDDNEYDSEEEDDEYEHEYVEDEEEREWKGSVSLAELRELLDECRRMSEEGEREQSPFQFFLTPPTM